MATTSDDERLQELATVLADTVETHVAGWIEGLVLARAGRGEDVVARARDAGDAARSELMPILRELLAADPDEQAANPLALLRAITGHAAEALDDLGVAPAPRGRFAEEAFPDDRHGLVPATWADIHPSLHEPGIAWGAAKAFVVKRRHRS